jgi:hypothetical protein
MLYLILVLLHLATLFAIIFQHSLIVIIFFWHILKFSPIALKLLLEGQKI